MEIWTLIVYVQQPTRYQLSYADPWNSMFFAVITVILLLKTWLYSKLK
jgi:hypothetical protein